MAITREEFEQLEALSKETEQLRCRLEDLRQRSIVSAYNISGSRTRSGRHSDRVCDLVAAKDELQRKINRSRFAMNALINKIYNPLSLSGSCTPLDMRVSTVLRLRYLEGMSWDQVGQQLGIKGVSCRHMVSKYKRALK